MKAKVAVALLASLITIVCFSAGNWNAQSKSVDFRDAPADQFELNGVFADRMAEIPAPPKPSAKVESAYLEDLPGKNPFEGLKNLYDKEGVPPTKTDMTGWRSGFFVHDSYPDVQISALLIGTDTGGGTFKVTSMRYSGYDINFYRGRRADNYDVIFPGDLRGIKEDVRAGYWSHMITFTGVAVKAYIVDAKNRTKKTIEYRKARNGIVERTITTKASKYNPACKLGGESTLCRYKFYSESYAYFTKTPIIKE